MHAEGQGCYILLAKNPCFNCLTISLVLDNQSDLFSYC